MNNPNHISESLEAIFLTKILKFFDADPGSEIGKIRIQDPGFRIRDKHLGSATLLKTDPDPGLKASWKKCIR
jgi:hypothetical protein